MADLTGKTIANGYPNLVTIGATTNDNPTSGTLENGKGNNLTAVGIGTDSPSSFLANGRELVLGDGSDSHGMTIFSDSAGTGNLFFADGTTGDEAYRGFLRYTHSSDSMQFYTAGANERMRINSTGEVGIGTSSPAKELDVDGEIRASGGILFGTDTAAANALDDYEEGTWTPVYSPQTGSFTTMTMTTNNGTYTKIGRQVTVRAFISTNEVVVGTASGFLNISGLPFASAGSNTGYAGAIAAYTQNWSTAPDSAYVRDGESEVSIMKTNSTVNADVSDLTTGAVASQNRIMFTATYFV